jgi:hypothetical protein
MAFFIFVAVYVYAIMEPLSDSIVETAGHIALIASLFMMLRNDITANAVEKLIDNIKIGK